MPFRDRRCIRITGQICLATNQSHSHGAAHRPAQAPGRADTARSASSSRQSAESGATGASGKTELSAVSKQSSALTSFTVGSVETAETAQSAEPGSREDDGDALYGSLPVAVLPSNHLPGNHMSFAPARAAESLRSLGAASQGAASQGAASVSVSATTESSGPFAETAFAAPPGFIGSLPHNTSSRSMQRQAQLQLLHPGTTGLARGAGVTGLAAAADDVANVADVADVAAGQIQPLGGGLAEVLEYEESDML